MPRKQIMSINSVELKLIESNTKLVDENRALKTDNSTLQEYVRFLEKIIKDYKIKLKKEEKDRMIFLRKGLYISKWKKKSDSQ